MALDICCCEIAQKELKIMLFKELLKIKENENRIKTALQNSISNI